VESERFDRLSRVIGSDSSRRAIARVLTGLALGGSVGLLGRAEGEAAKSGTCLEACPTCQVCQQGKCKRKHRKKKCKPGLCVAGPDGGTCGNSVCKVCQGGACVNAANGSTCDNNPCKECQGGACANKANGTACNGTGQCLNGTCNTKPTCLGTGADCTQAMAASCCSGVCKGDNHCQNSGTGSPCLQTSDCITPAKCVGYICQPG